MYRAPLLLGLVLLSAVALAQPRYTRLRAEYQIPDVTLVNAHGEPVQLRSLLDQGPIVLQFVFTTCSTICFPMTAGLAQAQDRLSALSPNTRLISISIDPEHDVPSRLQEYAASFDAGENWHFLTGSVAEIQRVQRAFNSLRANKMWHEPSTFLRSATNTRWLRLNGLTSPTQLVAEYRRVALE